MDDFTPMDCSAGSPISDDPFSLSALLTLDNYPELFSPFSSSSSPFTYPTLQQFSNPSADMNSFTSSSADDSNERMLSAIPKSIQVITLAERMLKALSLFKESLGGGILAQVWMPVKHENGYVLSTSDQPFLLDQILAGYREVSRAFTFSAEEAPGLFPGLPGRVFISGLPEWTSNVVYYNNFEYLRAEHAHTHEVRGSLAVPVFDPKERSCCAVLELVTTKEKPDFDMEMDSVCNALQAVELRTITGQTCKQPLTKYQKSAFDEILDVLGACCHAHMLPLALTWVPFSYDSERVPDSTKEVVRGLNSKLTEKSLLCIEESACYVNDSRMNGFLHACAEHCLEKGQGISGRALESNHPFFSADVKGYDMREFPLAHHARKYGLNAAVAIRLRSTFTGNDDYILEFFLPVNCRGSSEQQELLNNLSNTMQRICRSLRTVSDVEILAGEKKVGTNSSLPEISIKHSPQMMDSDNELSGDFTFEDMNAKSGERGDASCEQLKSDSTIQPEKKRSTSEKNISLSVLQQYFSGSLKDAAKCIGVCPTTLKRICRQHGISRWPSRKINKVNRSLKKIQTVIDSVQGVEGALRYDPSTGCLVAAVSTEKPKIDQDPIPTSSTPDTETERLITKPEFDESPFSNPRMNNLLFPDAQPEVAVTDTIIKEHSHPSYSSMTDSSSASASSCPTFRKNPKAKMSPPGADNGTTITVKATYKDDTVRFKFLPLMGCQQLLEEIGKRYKLEIGTFQLKYMDDEDEWVLLSSDADLSECVEVLESLGSKNLKLLVRDLACNFGSSRGCKLECNRNCINL